MRQGLENCFKLLQIMIPCLIISIFSSLAYGGDEVGGSDNPDDMTCCALFFARATPPPGYRIKSKDDEVDVKDSAELMPRERPETQVYIEVNIPATQLTLYEDGKPLFVKPVAVGQGGYPTPEQASFIRRIEWNPWWYPPASGWAKGDRPTPPSPRNPMGRVKMPLDDAILFHGTYEESSVGRPVSHGCMRMLNEDAAEIAWYLQQKFSSQDDPKLLELYKRNRRRTYRVKLDRPVPVRIVYEPIVLKGDTLIFYTDYYGRFSSAMQRANAIREKLLDSGIKSEDVDEEQVKMLVEEKLQDDMEIMVDSLLKPRLPIKEIKSNRRRKGRYLRHK